MEKVLKWKVCGMREEQNIADVLALEPDFMGFIVYPKSPRYVSDQLSVKQLLDFPESTKKVAVTVNQEIASVLDFVHKHKMQFVQLHGKESPEDCIYYKESGVGVIKAFSVDKDFDFSILDPYLSCVDYFLFDTKAAGAYGGHGIAFDWEILTEYTYPVPYFLAGGIDLENMKRVQKLKSTTLAVLDINSKFETEKAFKNIAMLKHFEKELNNLNNNGFYA